MSTNEPTPEKRTAEKPSPDEPAPDQPATSEHTMPEDPPVHPEHLLNDDEPDADSDRPPQTRLLITGFAREEITADFLMAIHDLAEDHDLDVESISVGEPDQTDE